MPETTIDKNGDACASEHYVSPSLHACKDLSVNPVAKAKRVKSFPQSYLGLGVPSFLALHTLQRRRRRGFRANHQMYAKVVSYSLAIRTIMPS